MVNVFGDNGSRSSVGLPKNIKLVREVKKTSGLFKDYLEQIKKSIQLGFIPYRYEVHTSITMPCYMFVYEGRILQFGTPSSHLKEIENYRCTPKEYLTYWEEVANDDDDDDGSVTMIVGPQGPCGPQGKRGLTGLKGEEGPAGKRGRVGAIGPDGPKGGIGPQGMKGDPGPKGEKGDSGSEGPRGDIGPRGMKGDPGPKGERGDSGSKGPQGDIGPRGTKGDPGPKGEKGDQGPKGARGPSGSSVSKSFVIDMIEHATSHDCAFIASLKEDVTVTDRGMLLNNWNITKIDDRVVQIQDKGAFVISQSSRCSVYLHCRAEKRTLEKVTFTIFSNTLGKQVSAEVVRLPKGESISILIHHTVDKRETLTVRIFGTDLDFKVEKSSRVEITETHRWEAPELIVANKVYPWKVGVLKLDNDIEKYQYIYITAQLGSFFLYKTIYPTAMLVSKQEEWSAVIANDSLQKGEITLTFSGIGHKTLQLRNLGDFSIISMYGVRC